MYLYRIQLNFKLHFTEVIKLLRKIRRFIFIKIPNKAKNLLNYNNVFFNF